MKHDFRKEVLHVTRQQDLAGTKRTVDKCCFYPLPLGFISASPSLFIN